MVCQGKMVRHELPRGRWYFQCDECGVTLGNTARHPGRATCQKCGDFYDDGDSVLGGSGRLTVMSHVCPGCRTKGRGRGGN